MANYQQIKTLFPTKTEYTLDVNKDEVEFGFPVFRSRIDRDTGEIFHLYLIVKRGPKADQIRKFFKRKKESIQQPDGAFLDLRDVALDYYGNLGFSGYKDVRLGKEPNLNIDELNYIKEEIEDRKKRKKNI